MKPTEGGDIVDNQEKMPIKEFGSFCFACGGNWSAMLMSGIRTLKDKDQRFKKIWDNLEDDRSYEFEQLEYMLRPVVDMRFWIRDLYSTMKK